jgi:hypothetical protein
MSKSEAKTEETTNVPDTPLTVNGMLLLENKELCKDKNYTLFRLEDKHHPERHLFKSIHHNHRMKHKHSKTSKAHS